MTDSSLFDPAGRARRRWFGIRATRYPLIGKTWLRLGPLEGQIEAGLFVGKQSRYTELSVNFSKDINSIAFEHFYSMT